MAISISETAAHKIRSLMAKQGIDDGGLRVGVKGDRDPGYGSTSKMITEAAVCLLENRGTPGGIWTTAPAMGDKLIARLQAHAGLKFGVEEAA